MSQNLAGDFESPEAKDATAIRQREPAEVGPDPIRVGSELEEVAQFEVDGVADGEEGAAGVGGGFEAEAAGETLVGGAVGKAEESGGEDVVGRDRDDGGVEAGGEEAEQEGE